MALLHVVDPITETAGNKLRKVEGFVDYFKSRCVMLYQPRQQVAIDERMVISCHRSGIRQYIKDKLTKWGIKWWVLGDSSNAFVCDFDIYIGREAGRQISEYGLGYNVVMKLMQNYLNQGCHLFIDNFYTSLTLAKHLFQLGVLTTGTILVTRRDFPANLKNGKQWAKGNERGNMRWERDPPVLAIQWVDNKVVSTIFTAANANDTVRVKRKRKTAGVWNNNEVTQPQVFQTYNRYMNAVDRGDQIATTHNIRCKCMRWWKTLFFHLVDMAIINSFILFREQQQRFPENDALKRPQSFSQANFHEELVRDICNFPKVDVPPQNTTVRPQPPAGHFDTVHIPNCGMCKGGTRSTQS